MPDIDTSPGLLFVLGALLPLVGFVLVALLALLRHFLWPHREAENFSGTLYQFIFGEQPGYAAGFVATLTAALALLFGLLGLGAYLDRSGRFYESDPREERQPVTDRQAL